MAAAAGKKRTTSLSLIMEAFGVEEELSAMATQTWAEEFGWANGPLSKKEAWMRQIFEVQSWRQVRGPAGAVTCEIGDLGIKWSQWHTLIFEGQAQVDMRHVCPKDVK